MGKPFLAILEGLKLKFSPGASYVTNLPFLNLPPSMLKSFPTALISD